MHPPYEALDIDININNVAGVYNSHLCHAKFDTRFAMLVLLVKHWAINAKINEAQYGTLNRLFLFEVLLILFLQLFTCATSDSLFAIRLSSSRFTKFTSDVSSNVHNGSAAA